MCCYKIGEKAWTASTNDKNQYLIIDLGQVMNISMIATQGRENNGEYVMEYSISYGTNNLDYVDYKEEEGNTKVNQFISTMTNKYNKKNNKNIWIHHVTTNKKLIISITMKLLFQIMHEIIY